jgi:hypothetical protein
MKQWFGRRTPALLKKTSLRIEPLEDRCLPSTATALPLDLGAGLDGDSLLSEPLFRGDQGHKNSKGLLAALTGSNPAGNAATPVTGSAVSGAAAPAPRLVGVQTAPLIVSNAPNATITVNTLADENVQGDSTLSLREAIALVDGTLKTSKLSAAELAQVSGTPGTGNQLIQFASGLTGTIRLNSALPDLISPNANNTSIQGGGAIKIDEALVVGYALTIQNNVTATISGMTFTNGQGALVNFGNLTVSYSTFSYAGASGAIRDAGITTPTLTVQSCTFNSNTAGGGTPGGALSSMSTDVMTISKSTFTSNEAGFGGAIADVGANSTVSITGSTFTGNSATGPGGPGGAIFASNGTASISGCTFKGNFSVAAAGGAISLAAETSVNVSGCTFTGNRANGAGAQGGAVTDLGSTSITLSNDTITGNEATKGGGVYGQNDTMTITNTVISLNAAGTGGGLSWLGKGVAGNSLTVSNCSISGNNAGAGGGGGVSLTGRYPMTFKNCYIGNNYSTGAGGGVSTIEALPTFDTCLIANNTALTKGGGVYNQATFAYFPSFRNCTVSGNKAASGGGFYNNGSFGRVYLTNTTVSGNTATTGNGGGVYDHGSAFQAVNSTFANNVATLGKGGAVYENGVAIGGTRLDDSTIAFNQATAGGGIYTKAGAAGSVVLQNTIVAANTLVGSSTASDIAGASAAAGAYSNLIGTGGTGGITAINGNQINVTNPGLGTLGNNGGPTQTIMLQPGSPAIDKGDKTKVPVLTTTDQRGLPRVVGANVDIGAVEVQPAGAPTHFVTQISPRVSAGIPSALGVTVEDDFGTVITGFTGTVTFSSLDPTATLPTPYTFTAADAGVHNFSVTLNTLGTQLIFLNDAADKLSATVQTTVVTPPASGAAFIDGINQLWVFQNGKFTNTGGFAKIFSAGIDAAGNAEVWFLDGINQLWRWDNGVFTNTGGFAQKIAAGQGLVAFSDGINQLWTFSDTGSKFTNTGGFASRFTAGFDVLGHNQIDFADGINQLWTFDVTTSKFSNTGGFTKLFVAGQDAFGNNEIWFTDGNNQIWRLDNGVFTKTAGFALTITGSANGTMYFSDGINQIWQLTDFGVFTNTGGFASHISGSPATTALFFSDGINQLWQFFNGVFTNTGGFASNFSAF